MSGFFSRKPAADGKAEPLMPVSARERWTKVSHSFRFLMAMDGHAFMKGLARPIDSSQIEDYSPYISELSDKVTEMATKYVAPTEAEDLEIVGDSSALQTNGEAIVNLLNNCLGSGMLTMGYAIANAGIIPAILMMMLSAFLNRFTLLLNIKTCGLAGCDPASAEIGEAAFGQVGRVSLILLYTIFGFLCCVSYVDAAADAVAGILSLLLGEEPPFLLNHVGCWALLLLPTTLIRSLKAVALLSFVAFMGGVVMLLAVTLYCLEDLLARGFPSLSELSFLLPSVEEFTQAFPILLLIFSIQAGGGVVLATMRDTSEENVRAVSRNAYLLVLLMDFFIGFVAYITFLGDVQGNVLLNFSPTDPIAVIARFALLDLVVLSYMIMMIPCKLSLIDLVFNKNEARLEASTSQFYGVTAVLNVCALLVALSVSDLSLVNGLNGAVCTNLVAFVLPTAFYLKIRSTPDGGSVPLLSLSNAPYFAIAAFGLFSLVSSSSSIVQRFMAGGA